MFWECDADNEYSGLNNGLCNCSLALKNEGFCFLLWKALLTGAAFGSNELDTMMSLIRGILYQHSGMNGQRKRKVGI